MNLCLWISKTVILLRQSCGHCRKIDSASLKTNRKAFQDSKKKMNTVWYIWRTAWLRHEKFELDMGVEKKRWAKLTCLVHRSRGTQYRQIKSPFSLECRNYYLIYKKYRQKSLFYTELSCRSNDAKPLLRYKRKHFLCHFLFYLLRKQKWERQSYNHIKSLVQRFKHCAQCAQGLLSNIYTFLLISKFTNKIRCLFCV